MKKVIAVLLAMLMLCSVMTVAFSAFAEETTAPTEVSNTEETKEEEMPDWFTNLINRLMEVFTKLLAKLALKISLKGFDISDLFPTEPTTAPTTTQPVAA